MEKWKTYVKSILIPLILGGIVGFITAGRMDYQGLDKPPLSPPGILFPIVWTILYILMGVSYAILEVEGKHDTQTKRSYYLQLVVNLLWPIFFFVFKWRLFSFFWILLLLISVIAMTIKFYQQNKTAGLLQIPYLIWVLFATYLNLGIYLLNR